MKKILLLLGILPMMLASCGDKEDDLSDKYDYVYGDSSKGLVTVKFLYGNESGLVGELYKTWGVEKGASIRFGTEPKFPSTKYTSAIYGYSADVNLSNDVFLSDIIFDKDTTLYVKWFGAAQNIKFCIPNGPTNKGSGMMFEQEGWCYNSAITKLPTLDDQEMDTDFGGYRLSQSLNPWVTQWGYTSIVGWYLEETLTTQIKVGDKIGSFVQMWAKCN